MPKNGKIVPNEEKYFLKAIDKAGGWVYNGITKKPLEL